MQIAPALRTLLDPAAGTRKPAPSLSHVGLQLRVVLIGGTGMIGSWLGNALRDRGDEVYIVTRSSLGGPYELGWTMSRGVADVRRLEGMDAVINLVGAPIADRPWTKMRRRVIRESRLDATRVIMGSLARLEAPPKTYVGMGHLGFYGDRGDTILDEKDERGDGFLAELAMDWEASHLAAAERIGARGVVLRMAVSLAPTGGVFPLMLQPFRVGLGGWLGDGKQYLPWIGIRDTVGAITFLLDREDLHGVFNGCVPEPTRQKDWAKALGRALDKPVLRNAPKWALRGALGELANHLFLASIRAVPGRLQRAGFRFEDADAESTFRWLVHHFENPDDGTGRHRPSRRRGGRRIAR